MDKKQTLVNTDTIFAGNFLDNKAFYQYCYHKVPCVTWVDQVNTAKALAYIKKEYADAIEGIFQYCKYSRKRDRTEYDQTIILLRDNCLVELEGCWCNILHTHRD